MKFLRRVSVEWGDLQGSGKDVSIEAVVDSNRALLKSNRALARIIDNDLAVHYRAG